MSIPATKLEDISKQINGKPASAAFPSNLPLELLQQVARDLRTCEVAMKERAETTAFAAPFALILHIVSKNRSKKNGGPTELIFEEKTAHEWFQIFTYLVERELVGRIVGVDIDKTDDIIRLLK